VAAGRADSFTDDDVAGLLDQMARRATSCSDDALKQKTLPWARDVA
jgi:hypothetical protein